MMGNNDRGNYGLSRKGYNEAEVGEETSERSPTTIENLPDSIVPELAAKLLKKSVKTFYDWKYRGKMRKEKIPPELFVKLGGRLYLRKDVLINWAFHQSSSS